MMANAKPMTAAAVLGSLLTACVDPSVAISTELTRYGLDTNQAVCVGDRLEASLSVAQLKQLGGAARAYASNDDTPGRLTLSDFVRVAARIEDPRVPLEVGKAAAGCGVFADALLSLR